MKIKTDFVTNSSSTSYIVVVPLNFKTTKEELESVLDWQLDDKEEGEESFFFSSALDGIDTLQNGHTIYPDDINEDSFYALQRLFLKKEMVISRVETGTDGLNSITGIKSEVIQKVFLTICDLQEIKEIIDR